MPDTSAHLPGQPPNRLAILTQYTRNSVIITDLEGHIKWVNGSFERTTGYTMSEVIGKQPGKLLQGPDTDPGAVSRMRAGLQTGDGFDVEVLNYHRDGRPVWFRIHCSRLDYDDCGHDGFIAIQVDITGQKVSEQGLRIAASVFERSHDAIMITDQSNRIIDVNPAFSRITGYPKDEVLGRSPSLLSSGKQAPDFYRGMWSTLQQRQHWRGEITNRRRNGEEYTELLSINKVQLDGPEQWHYVAVFSDITPFKLHAQELDRASYYDELTGLANSRLLKRRLDDAMVRVGHNQQSLAIVRLDLDRFMDTNNRFGQASGDRVLATIARRLKSAVRREDIVARLNGDEFVLVLPAEHIEATSARLLQSIRKPIPVGPTTVSISASAGIVLCPDDTQDADRSLRYANQAMLHAKESGGNRYHRFDTQTLKCREQRVVLLGELERALLGQEFELYYQPQVDTDHHRVTGVEALLRWRHPQRGLLGPNEFLPQATGSSLEVPIGQWVLAEGLRQQCAWQKVGVTLPMCINISARQLLAPGFTEYLRALLARYPTLTPSNITLEVLESTALDDIQHAGNVIQQCRDLGLLVALDDFGTGYSSLAYFRTLPIDLVKIDQGFIRNMTVDANDRAIVESVIFLAKRFQRPVLAEGVETVEHARLLHRMGCDFLQGYGIARPMPADQVLDWRTRWSEQPPRIVSGSAAHPASADVPG